MPNLVIDMTEAQLLALDLITPDKQAWADNVLTNRARVAIEDLKPTPQWAQALSAHVQDGGDVNDDEAILLKGRELELFKTAAEVDAIRQGSEADIPATPTLDPLTLPLNQVQFFTIMEFVFKLTEEQIVDEIKTAITDELTQLAAINKFKRQTDYHRDNDLFALLAPKFSISDEELDAAWVQGLSIK